MGRGNDENSESTQIKRASGSAGKQTPLDKLLSDYGNIPGYIEENEDLGQGRRKISLDNGTEMWFLDGHLDRDEKEGPALIYNNGLAVYYSQGLIDRQDGPAVVNDINNPSAGGSYRRQGKSFTPENDTPASTLMNGEKVWVDENSLPHRDNDPAKTMPLYSPLLNFDNREDFSHEGLLQDIIQLAPEILEIEEQMIDFGFERYSDILQAQDDIYEIERAFLYNDNDNEDVSVSDLIDLIEQNGGQVDKHDKERILNHGRLNREDLIALSDIDIATVEKYLQDQGFMDNKTMGLEAIIEGDQIYQDLLDNISRPGADNRLRESYQSQKDSLEYKEYWNHGKLEKRVLPSGITQIFSSDDPTYASSITDNLGVRTEIVSESERKFFLPDGTDVSQEISGSFVAPKRHGAEIDYHDRYLPAKIHSRVEVQDASGVNYQLEIDEEGIAKAIS